MTFADLQRLAHHAGYTRAEAAALLDPDVATEIGGFITGFERAGFSEASIASLRGDATDAQIGHASEAEVRRSLSEIADDFLRGLSNVRKTPARKAAAGEAFDMEDGRSALREHRDYWRDRRQKEDEADDENYQRMDRVHSDKTDAEVEREIERLRSEGRRLQNDREISDGRRRTGAAVSNEAARDTFEQANDLERYLQDRRSM